MHMWRQIMFLQRAAGTSRAEFLARWPDVTDAIANGHGPKPRRIVENHPLDPMEQGLCGDVIPAAYDGVYEFWFCSEKEAMDALPSWNASRDLRLKMDRWIDKDNSLQWLAEIHMRIDLPGTAATLILAGKAADGYDVERAQQYWRDIHPKVFLAEKDFAEYITGYVQNHGRDRTALQGLDLFGRYEFMPLCGHMGLRSLRDILTAYTLPSYAGPIRADEAVFGKPDGALAFASTKSRSTEPR
ncbi:hypothetical protein AI27_05155 [Sphingomonas sp. BHC-A]|uniref:EthD domain-containing protein n=1 Tax=Sphingobium indicum (strain DSM 16412 / CCM 7286 / MTCC 6364 / B90A) TaxID=861109 RepID=A0A1L5BQ94_SPHIB|nr:EthD domain-containing protein [Sphingobium indicum]APL95074.1 hypothetical protein SIDU_11460 [Sphingobium indicum B90A]KEY99320.1 hypothetical protein AI27_05155 [Sphingomonas sp. BHC-A]